jgi:hypothetical protein
MTEWITSILRKIVFAACGTIIAKIVASGAISEAQLTTWVELSLAILVAGGGWRCVLDKVDQALAGREVCEVISS